MFELFRKKTPEEKVIKLKCEIAALEKEVEVLWKLENNGNYLFGNRKDLINFEKKLAYKSKLANLLQIAQE